MRKARTVEKVSFPAPDVLTKIVPAPTDGWDAISPLANMDPKRAAVLINWIPRPGWLELRTGYLPWVIIDAVVPVETLMVRRANGAEQMFAAAGNTIYDVSIEGAISPVVTGLNSARWQYINFTPAASATVIQCVNGVDTLRQYNGTAWSVPTISGLPGGLTTAAIRNIYAQKRRLWYVLGDGSGKGSTVAAFMPTDAISGAISGTLDLGAMFTKGGTLEAMSDWTIDGGNGPQDYAVFISSRGQVAIFSGVDPTNADNWTLVGTFDLSPPIGLRCMTKIGSDVGVITQQGILPISQSLPFDPSADRSVSITARIQNAMSQASMAAKNNFGWQLISAPNQQLGILNVPLSENLQQVQFIMNALTGAWTQFQGWNANCFEIYDDEVFFGDNVGGINKAFSGGLDLLSPIQADMQCAYNYFDDPGRNKRMSMVQPLLTVSGTVTPQISVDADFSISQATSPVQVIAGGALWDFATWDTALWSGGVKQYTPWLSAEALGHALAVHMTVNVAPQVVAGGIGEFDFGRFDNATFDAGVHTESPTLQVNAFNAIVEMGAFI